MSGLKKAVHVYMLWSVCSFLFASQPLEGNWVSPDDKTGQKRAIINLTVTNGELTGTIKEIFPLPGDTGICSKCPGKFKDKPIKGMEIIWGLKESKPGVWDGGHVLDAKTGKVYRAKMTIKNDKLYVRGYIGISMLGRTQVWERT